MKKVTTYILVLLAGGLFIVSCKKKENDISTIQTVSFPTITGYGNVYKGSDLVSYYIGVDVTAQIVYYSFAPGKAPAFDVSSVTAFDTTGPVPVTTELNGNLNPNQTGLYIYQFSAKSKYGFASRVMYVIAVTSADTATDLSDTYTGVRGTDTTSVTVQKMATGIYLTFDAAVTALEGSAAASFFAQTDNTHIAFPAQPTLYDYQNQPFANLGILSGSNGIISLASGKPVIQYTLGSPTDTLGINGQNVMLFGQ